MSSLLSLLPGKEFSVSGMVGGVVKDWFSHSSVANYIKVSVTVLQQSYMIQMSLLVGIAGEETLIIDDDLSRWNACHNTKTNRPYGSKIWI